MRRHVAQPTHCVALGIRQDRLVAQVDVRQGNLCLRGGFMRLGGLTDFARRESSGKPVLAAHLAARAGMRGATLAALRTCGGTCVVVARRYLLPLR